MSERVDIQVRARDGSVGVGSVVLQSGMSLQVVRQSLQAHPQSEDDLRNGYLWLSIGRVALGGCPAGLGLCFHREKLETVTFGVSLPDDQLFENWPTEETSRRQVKFMQQELARQLGRPFRGHARFRWGNVWANFDVKGFMASAGLTYGR